MGIRENRLIQDLTSMERLREQSSQIDFVVNGPPPDEYLVTFRCQGMIDSQNQGSEHVARVYLHADYPKLPPLVTFLTPCFHPNIAALIQMSSVQAQIQKALALAADAAARQEILREVYGKQELFTAHVCLDALDHNWSPGITLEMICIELGEMIQYKRFNVDDPLNLQAATWARQNATRLPVDRRELLDLRGLEGIRILEEASIDGLEDLQIRFCEPEVSDA